RLSGAAIVMSYDTMIFGKFFNLIDFPDFAVACGLAEKNHGPALAVVFIVNFNVVQFNLGHPRLLAAVLKCFRTTSCINQLPSRGKYAIDFKTSKSDLRAGSLDQNAFLALCQRYSQWRF